MVLVNYSNVKTCFLFLTYGSEPPYCVLTWLYSFSLVCETGGGREEGEEERGEREFSVVFFSQGRWSHWIKVLPLWSHLTSVCSLGSGLLTYEIWGPQTVYSSLSSRFSCTLWSSCLLSYLLVYIKKSPAGAIGSGLMFRKILKLSFLTFFK